ncbi:MAG: ATP-dependent helicase [Firmicutes bacterium HGW-Firmicutes-15]|nr:MAG: ATP-dependent helicase [Firmicutes bacterium HGW-Firmicutes-15]
MNSSFKNLGISPPILKALEDMGFEAPTEVQSRSIPYILNHEDLIVMSKTGSGKTAVFGVSMLQMTDPGVAEPQGLILTPTRELAVQVDSDLKQMSKHLQHKTTAVYGQHNMNVEIQALNKGVSIVSGTPGRVYDHISHGNLKTKHIRFLVLDEADRMLDMGFLDQVVRIIKTLPTDRVTLLFSATIPGEIRKICREYMKHPVTIEIESETMTVDTTQQVYYRVNNDEKRMQLNRLLLVEQPESCMIFCNTRIMVDRVQSFLSRKGYASQSLHGDIPQIKRLKTLQQFKQGEFHLLVATDVAARGIHIDDLSLVINYDVPIEKDSYVHRIGRTGRAGNGGRAITLVTGEDIMSLYEIEEHIGAMITEAELPSEAVFNEQRSSIDKWIKANSQKINSPRVTSESNLRETQNKRSHTNPPQRNEKHKDRPIVVNMDHKTIQRVNTVYTAEQAKPVHVIAMPVPTHSTEADVVHAKLSTGIVQSQDSTTKKPFLQRVIQRILGK